MKIHSFQSEIVSLPLEEPLAGGYVEPGAVREFVTLTLRTDDGVEGIGYTFFGAAITPALHAAVEGLATLIVGQAGQQWVSAGEDADRLAGRSHARR